MRPAPYTAVVGGFAAFALTALVEEPRLREQLRRLAERGADPARVRALARAWASLRRAADEWVAAETSAVSAVDAAVLPVSAEVDTAIAAAALGVTESRVRQRLRAGRLAGRKLGSRWRVNVDAVRAEVGRDGRVGGGVGAGPAAVPGE